MPKEGLAIVIGKRPPGGKKEEDESGDFDTAMGSELMEAFKEEDSSAVVQIIRDIVSGV